MFGENKMPDGTVESTITLDDKKAAILEIYKKLYEEGRKLKRNSDYSRNKSAHGSHGLFVNDIDSERAYQRYRIIESIRKSIVDYVYCPDITTVILSARLQAEKTPLQYEKIMISAKADVKKKVQQSERIPLEVSQLDFKITMNTGGIRISTIDDAMPVFKSRVENLNDAQCMQVLDTFLTDIEKIRKARPEKNLKTSHADSMTFEEQKHVLQTHSISDKWFFSIFAKLAKMVRQTLGTKTSSEKVLEGFEETQKKLGIFTLKERLKETKDETPETHIPTNKS